MRRAAALLAVLLLAAGSALADRPLAVVDAVQMPAWVERGGTKAPLAPGTDLRATDRLLTGSGARLLLKFADDSLLQVGENVTLDITTLVRSDESVLTAAFDVIAGAIRYTTSTVARMLGRDITLKVAAVTAGVRGTDVWGKAGPDRDVICLIEGRVEVRHGTDPSVTLDQPKTFYIVPKGKPPEPVGPVSDEQLGKWAAQTALETGKGILRRGGIWEVRLPAMPAFEDAFKLYLDARGRGVPVDMRPITRAGKRHYQVVVKYVSTRAEAEALLARLQADLGVTGGEVTE